MQKGSLGLSIWRTPIPERVVGHSRATIGKKKQSSIFFFFRVKSSRWNLSRPVIDRDLSLVDGDLIWVYSITLPTFNCACYTVAYFQCKFQYFGIYLENIELSLTILMLVIYLHLFWRKFEFPWWCASSNFGRMPVPDVRWRLACGAPISWLPQAIAFAFWIVRLLACLLRLLSSFWLRFGRCFVCNMVDCCASLR